MRFDYFLLVVTATLLASANAALEASTNSKLAIVPDFHVTETFAAGTAGTATKRFLRTKTTTIEEEERDPLFTNVLTKFRDFFKIGAASKLSKQAETVVTKQKMLEEQQTYLDDAFAALKVNKVEGNIFKSRELKDWVVKRQEFNKKFQIEDESGFQIISKYFKDDQRLSLWINIARGDPKLKGLVDQFRAGQLSHLLSVGAHPHEVYILLNVRKLGVVSNNRDLYQKYVLGTANIGPASHYRRHVEVHVVKV